MVIGEGGGCGSDGNVRIQVMQNNKNNHLRCTTEDKWDFSSGDTLIWRTEALGECKNVHFYQGNDCMYVLIQTGRDNNFCVKSVKIVLNDNTSYNYIFNGRGLHGINTNLRYNLAMKIANP